MAGLAVFLKGTARILVHRARCSGLWVPMNFLHCQCSAQGAAHLAQMAQPEITRSRPDDVGAVHIHAQWELVPSTSSNCSLRPCSETANPRNRMPERSASGSVGAPLTNLRALPGKGLLPTSWAP